jgi:hypothetical protein
MIATVSISILRVLLAIPSMSAFAILVLLLDVLGKDNLSV